MNGDEPFIAPSARKHGITDADMIKVFDDPGLVHAMTTRPHYRRR